LEGLVAALWLTIGLPILAVIARADARNGGAREVLAAVVRKAWALCARNQPRN
jgi:hypothetical protein